MRLDDIAWTYASEVNALEKWAQLPGGWRIFHYKDGRWWIGKQWGSRSQSDEPTWSDLDIVAAQCVLYHLFGNPTGNS